MKSFLPSFLLVFLFASCQKEDLRAYDFAFDYTTRKNHGNADLMIGTITNVSSTPANTVSITIDRYTDLNLVQDPIIIQIDKQLFQNDTAHFLFESSTQIKRVEIKVVDVK